jgi:hypothetical protein
MPETTYKFIGMNNVADPANVGAPDVNSRTLVFTEVVQLTNVDPNDSGGVSLRRGRVSALDIPGLHSGWSNPFNPQEGYFVNGTLLNRVDLQGNIKVIRYDMIPGIHVAFCQVNEVVVYSNGFQFGIIEDDADTARDWQFDQLKSPMVAGKHMAFYDGRLYALLGRLLYASDSFKIHSMDSRRNIVGNDLTGVGTMVFPVDDGLFVGSDLETFWYGGKDPILNKKWDIVTQVAPYGVIPGTVQPIKAEKLGIRGLQGNACIWTSRQGVCIGASSGFFMNLTQNKVSYPPGHVGTAVIREERGQVHYLCALQSLGEAYNAWSAI